MTNFDMCTHVRNIMKNAPTLDFHCVHCAVCGKKLKKLKWIFALALVGLV
jgi:hypothetical protein